MKISNYEDAKHRDDRLLKCARIAKAILFLSDEQADVLIDELHDYKGRLTVTWNYRPTQHQVEAFRAAWELCGEPGVNTEHVLKS